MSETSLLIGDIGGTNARFALTNQDMESYHEERILKCADYESSESA
ncbi:MAG: glucokinase, partial [Gammaproteobacteria bacterium]|nr:glucokinase [Gammaproteobacteria bacterium]